MAHLWGKVRASIDAKQDKLTGSAGQVVGFDADDTATAVRGWSNPNLLDNWYFVDPINQRGKTNGFVAGEYTIDRWYSRATTSPAFTENGVLLTTVNNQPVGIGQVFEDSFFYAVVNKQVTLSFLTASGELGVVTQIVDPISIMEHNRALTTNCSAILYRWVGSKERRFQVLLNHRGLEGVGAVADTVVAIKLELGSQQTLAHKEGDTWVLNDPPPDKALELAKCQRYYERGTVWAVKYPYDNLNFVGGTRFMVEKRATPAIKIFADAGFTMENKIADINGDIISPTVSQVFANTKDIGMLRMNGSILAVDTYVYHYEASSEL